MQEFKYLIQVSAGDQRKNFGHQVKLFGYEFLASRYPMVAMSEENASSLTAPFFVVFCRTRKIREQYYSNSYPWLYSEILELQHQFVHINVNLVILCFLFLLIQCLFYVYEVSRQLATSS